MCLSSSKIVHNRFSGTRTDITGLYRAFLSRRQVYKFSENSLVLVILKHYMIMFAGI